MPCGKTNVVARVNYFDLREFFLEQFFAAVIVAGNNRDDIVIFIRLFENCRKDRFNESAIVINDLDDGDFGHKENEQKLKK